MPKRALITGVTGQDGSYLTELLLDKGYEVHGVVRRCSNISTSRIDHLFVDKHDPGARLFLHYGDMLDPMGLERIVAYVAPDEIYNLAAQSHVGTSFVIPEQTTAVIVNGTLALLEICRRRAGIRMYQASSSEMFGNSMNDDHRQNEDTPMRPVSPYGHAKLHAHGLCQTYREAYGVWVACGILFNHESPRRDERMVTRKITRALARIKLGLQDVVYLGNLDAHRDWGFAGEYVDAMWRMLQQDEPVDFVIGTGASVSVHSFLYWVGEHLGVNTGEVYRIDDRYRRPREVHELCADPAKAARVLDWTCTIPTGSLARMMADADLELAEQELALKDLTRPETSGTLVATTE
jgi:GDPmannose 4,6-dehydratase